MLIVALVIGLCLPVTGCGGSKVTKANAEKVTTGLTEKEVSDILGTPTDTAEVEMPDVGAALGGLAGMVPGGGDLPKPPAMKAKQATWKDGNKTIIVTFVNGKVSGKVATGF
jgi:hypothetical protein